MSRMHNPAHPGGVLREFLPKDLPVGEIASRLGVSRQALSALLNGRAGVSAEMALRLEAALGTSAEMWVQMQANHDLWLARQLGKPKVRRIAA
jgi:antitoxin HigA-1